MLHHSIDKAIDTYGVPYTPNIQNELNGIYNYNSIPHSSVSYSQANIWSEHDVATQLTPRNASQIGPTSLDFTFSSTHPSNPALSGISRAEINSLAATPANNIYNPLSNNISCESHSIPIPVASVLNHFKSCPIQFPIPALSSTPSHSQSWSNPSPYTTYPAPGFTPMSLSTSTIHNPNPSKKQRTRLYEPPKMASTKDFVPPDISGLSKREARLVKNRAAAFLSRQKKREAYEGMELQVAQLQEENEHLKSIVASIPSAQSLYTSHNSSTTSPFSSSSELDNPNPDSITPAPHATLHAQLIASQQREREYLNEIRQLRDALKGRSPIISATPRKEQQVWNEDVPELEFDENTSSSSSSTSATPLVRGISDWNNVDDDSGSSGKTGAGLGLMALLCALPSILKTSASSPLQLMQTTYNTPNPTTTLPIPYNSPNDDMFPFISWKDDSALNDMDCDLDLNSECGFGLRNNLISPIQKKTALELIMDSDISYSSRTGPYPPTADLNTLEISFVTEHTPKNDKLKVRIHSSSSKPYGNQHTSTSQNTLLPKPEPHTPILSSNTPLPKSSNRSPLRLFPDYTYDNSQSLAPYDPNNLNDRERLKNAILGPFFGACSSTDESSLELGLGLGFDLNSNSNNVLPYSSAIPHTSSLSYNTPFNSSSSKYAPTDNNMDMQIPESMNSVGNRPTLIKNSKRVRISLKTAPAPGLEGGEWNISII